MGVSKKSTQMMSVTHTARMPSNRWSAKLGSEATEKAGWRRRRASSRAASTCRGWGLSRIEHEVND
jgi:hypothetical protein